MSEYANFPEDFLKRTLDNLELYRGNYEITNLINNCLGLIILPNELLLENLPDYTFTILSKEFGFSKENILINIENDYSLKKILRGIRNGLAHGNIEQRTNNQTIIGIKITNTYNKKVKLSIECSIEEFENFAKKIALSLL